MERNETTPPHLPTHALSKYNNDNNSSYLDKFGATALYLMNIFFFNPLIYSGNGKASEKTEAISGMT